MAANGSLTVAAVLVAAGSGTRLGAAVPKAFVPIAGRALLEHAVGRFSGHPRIGTVVVVVPGERLDAARQLLAGAGGSGRVVCVVGGAERRDSVAAGLAVLAPEIDTVLVHDVARPFVPAEVIDRVLDKLADGAAAVVPAVAVADTVKRVDADTGDRVVETLDRARLRAVQTPQGFARSLLERAHAEGPAGAGAPVTDDAALVEALGTTVYVVDGSELAFKITTPRDVAVATALLEGADADA